MITIWYTAVEPFDPAFGEAWRKYVSWSGLTHLRGLVSFCTCPNAIKELTAEDWEYNVHEDFVLFFFTSLEYLLKRVAGVNPVIVLAAARNPQLECRNVLSDPRFEFKGYDVIDVCADISLLTNCGGFPDVFRNEELSDVGLIPSFERAVEIRRLLQEYHPDNPHTDCQVWALWEMAGPELKHAEGTSADAR